MKNNYLTVAACLFLSLIVAGFLQAQSTGPQFQDCNSSPISLCVSDEGVRLPLNNKIYLGEEDPDASLCSVHVTQKTKVKSTCGRRLQYEVQLFLEDDTSTAIILQSLTTITTDSAFEAELTFDSELSPDTLISKNGIPYSANCNAYHRLKWIVTDSCGESVICINKINLYDCSKPFLTDLNKLYAIRCNIVGLVNLQLDSILTDPNDDCTHNGEFLYSLYPDHYKQDSTFHICDVPAWGVELFYDIWMADDGNDINCDGIIEWNERNVEKQVVQFVFIGNGFIDCDTIDPYVLSGNIETEDKQGIEKVFVTLEKQGHVYPTFETQEDGHYFFYPVINAGYPLTIRPQRNDDHKNGVSTLDLVRIQKHLLGIESLSSPYDIIAADANNSQSVSAIDLVEIRKLILGGYTEFPHNKSWRFVRATYVFTDTLNPWSNPETITFDTVIPNNIDFIGIKIGDVNNTVKPNFQGIISREENETINLSITQQQYLTNEIIEIPISMNQGLDIQGFQFTISDQDLEFLDITPGTINVTAENFALFNDKMTLSWFDENGYNTNPGDILFTVKARAKRNGDLHQGLTINSDITEAEMYGMNDEMYFPVLKTSQSLNQNDLIVYTPEPNPWKEKTSIPFYLKSAGSITLEIFDLNGRSIYKTKGTYGEGKNEINLSSTDITARGLLYFVLNTTDTTTTHKMIILN